MINSLTDNESSVLEFFFLNPREEVHIRGLSEKLGLPYASVRNALESLEERDLIKKKELSKMTFYSKKDDKFRKWKKHWNIQRLENSGLKDFIEEEFRPKTVVLIGSFLEGRDTRDSDIDIVVESSRSKTIDLTKFEDELEREIDLTVVGDLSTEEKGFKNSVINGYILSGYIELF